MPETIQGLISVIITAFNRTRWLNEAVQSALHQDYPMAEILIVDDASGPEAQAAIESIRGQAPDRIRVLRQSVNQGPGPARERGRLEARGEFLQYLDSDDRLLPLKWQRQVDVLRSHPEVDIVYGVTRLIDEHGAALRCPYRWTGEDRLSLFPGLLVDRWWSTHTPLWRRSFSDRVGSWPALRYSEDWIYEARAGGLRARLARVPEVVCETRHHCDPRETGGRWLSPADQVLFFRVILQQAICAGVDRTGPEMHHFARWVFKAARDAARGGAKRESMELLKLARSTGADVGWDVRLFSIAAAICGPHVTVRAGDWVRSLGSGSHGRATMKQSWMRSDAKEPRV